MGKEFFHADGWMDGWMDGWTDKMKLRVAFLNSVNLPKNNSHNTEIQLVNT